MGVYGEYLNTPGLMQNFDAQTAERKNQIRRISQIRGASRKTDVLVFAADLNKPIPGIPINITYGDVLPISDQLSNLKGDRLDLILETPGGMGEVAEEIVRLIRGRYEEFAVIVPGWAKSAGTILAMAADEILMGPTSALGPIDAQLSWQGKTFSADALLEGFDKIKEEVQASGVLNKAYIPSLQNISPGELQEARNALKFATELVTDWLVQYKFKDWNEHSSTHQPVTPEEKKERAAAIAAQLCDHRRWRTHGRSIKIADLRAMRLNITDYSTQPDLADAVMRYYALMQISFQSNLYKIYETADSQVMKFLMPQVPPPQQFLQPVGVAEHAILNFQCPKCKATSQIQANLGTPQPLQPGSLPFPQNSKFRCPKCGVEHDLTDARRQLEAQSKKPVV
jgi:predicted RNA-binding Zn-ribbon protein involved in translation (DUF1610 family)